MTGLFWAGIAAALIYQDKIDWDKVGLGLGCLFFVAAIVAGRNSSPYREGGTPPCESSRMPL